MSIIFSLIFLLIVALGAETLFERQYLPHVNAIFAEEFVISVHEFRLSHGGEELALINGVECAQRHVAQLAAPAGHGTRGDEYHFNTRTAELGDLIYQRRHAGNIERAVLSGEHVAAHLDGDAFIVGGRNHSRFCVEKWDEI